MGLGVLLVPALAGYLFLNWKTVVPLDYSGTAAATIVLEALLPLVLNQFPRYDRFQAQQRAAVAAGDQISLIIDQAILQGRFVYAPAINDLVDRNLEILKVAFPMRDVVSAWLFDRELYVSFLDTQTATS